MEFYDLKQLRPLEQEFELLTKDLEEEKICLSYDDYIS